MSTLIKHDYKNSVFLDLFEQDDYRLQLFQTFHPEMTDVVASDIETLTLKQILINHQYNDLALLVKDKLMVFVEAQSTWSVNILVRMLLYLADTMQEYIHKKLLDVYSTKKMLLPKPEFYIIYTGKQKVPEAITLRNDFYQNEEIPIDLRAKVITAETDDIIGQYIIFSHVVDRQIQKHGRTAETALKAINICRDKGILTKYLQEREKEVYGIMVTLFDQQYALNRHIEVEMKEVMEKGRAEGRTEGIIEGRTEERKSIMLDLLRQRIPLPVLAKALSTTEEELCRLAYENGIEL